MTLSLSLLRTAGPARVWRSARRALPAAALVLAAGCSLDDLVGEAPLPQDIDDPGAVRTPVGAVAASNGALARLRDALSLFVASTGELSDELQSANALGSPYAFNAPRLLDARNLHEAVLGAPEEGVPVTTYARLHQVRADAGQAFALLRDFAPGLSPALQAHMLAVNGYAELMLAELFCSGVPLSTVDYDGDYTMRPGSSTAEVFEHARDLFDSALVRSDGSARIRDFARVGKARALLNLGEFRLAAEAVAEVPDTFRYLVTYTEQVVVTEGEATNFVWTLPATNYWGYSVADGEGTNGLPFRSSGDPRTASALADTNSFNVPLFAPLKYVTITNPDPANLQFTLGGNRPIVLADWVEARLVEAEAALRLGDPATWLAKLNHLRATAYTTIDPAPAGPLGDLDDPVDPDARVDLMFRERAYWLFLTGHRQGDLRRLIRQYGRPEHEVYPTGTYVAPSTYGSMVASPIPAAERENPLFTGCLSHGA